MEVDFRCYFTVVIVIFYVWRSIVAAISYCLLCFFLTWRSFVDAICSVGCDLVPGMISRLQDHSKHCEIATQIDLETSKIQRTL